MHTNTEKAIAPWFARPPCADGNKVAIVGAGLAGLMTAFHLCESNFQVTLYDENKSLPNLPSQNPAMLLKPSLSPDLNFFDQYYTSGFLGMTEFIKKYAPSALITEGLLDIATTPKKQDKLAKILIKRSLPETLVKPGCDIAGDRPALFYPGAQIIDPAVLTAALLQQMPARLELGRRVEPETLVADFDAVIIATGRYLHLGDILPGQISITKANADCRKIPSALGFEGYATLDKKDNFIIGSTYRHTASTTVEAEDHALNLQNLYKVAPHLAESLHDQALRGFVAARFSTPDHLPIIGGLAIKKQWFIDFDRLRFGDTRPAYPSAAYHSKLYVNLAHGSKGLSSSYLASKIITALLTGLPLPVSTALWQALQPARFWLRNLKCAT